MVNTRCAHGRRSSAALSQAGRPTLAQRFKSRGKEVSVPVEYGLADHIKRVSRRMFEVPEFFFYAIADGVGRLFARHGRWHGLDGPDETEETCQMELAL